MSGKVLLAVFGLGVVALVIAFTGPQLITTANENVTSTSAFDQGESQDLTDRLELTVDDVNETSNEVNSTFRSLKTENSSHILVAEGNQSNVTVDGDTLFLEVGDITSNSSAIVTATYPPLFGWDSGPRTFMENIHLLVAILLGVTAIGTAVVLFDG